jgi:hypothetical protein
MLIPWFFPVKFIGHTQFRPKIALHLSAFPWKLPSQFSKAKTVCTPHEIAFLRKLAFLSQIPVREPKTECFHQTFRRLLKIPIFKNNFLFFKWEMDTPKKYRIKQANYFTVSEFMDAFMELFPIPESPNVPAIYVMFQPKDISVNYKYKHLNIRVFSVICGQTIYPYQAITSKFNEKKLIISANKNERGKILRFKGYQLLIIDFARSQFTNKSGKVKTYHKCSSTYDFFTVTYLATCLLHPQNPVKKSCSEGQNESKPPNS